MKVKKLIAYALLVCALMTMPVFEVFAMQLQVQVEINENTVLTLEAEPTETVWDLKWKIQEKTEIDAEKQTLFFGDQLLDSEAMLQDYGVEEGATIKLAGPYTVTFKMNGHGNDQTMTVKYGDHVYPQDPVAEGYSFDYWYTDEGLTEAFDPRTTITADTVLYAKWYADCTVSFDNYGIGEAIEPRKVKYGTLLELPETPVAEGYTFTYWSTDERNSSMFDQTTPITEDMTLYACWAVKATDIATVDNITIHFDNYPVPDQPLTSEGVRFEAGELTSKLKIVGCSWSEWDYYAFDENRFPTPECKMSADSGSVMKFRAGKYYMFWCRVESPGGADPRMSIEVPSIVFPMNPTVTIDSPNHMDYQCWPWSTWVNPETEERSAVVLEIAVVFKAPEYKVIEDEITNTTYETGTEDVVTMHFNGDISLFDELIIDGNVVPEDQYTLTEGSTIVTLKSSYLETLESGDHTVTAVYNTNMYNEENAKDEVATVITVKKSEEKPAEPDPSTGGGSSSGAATVATPVAVYDTPNTGDISSITGYLISCTLSMAGIVGITKKRRK